MEIKNDVSMSRSLQENVLTALVFKDGAAPLLSANITADYFDSAIYRTIAKRALDFYEEFKQAPKEHIPDILEDILDGKDERKASLYDRVLRQLYEAANSLNTEYTLSKLNQFVRQQHQRAALIQAVEASKNGKLDKVDDILTKYLSQQITTFSPGLRITDPNALDFLDESVEVIPTGISFLDQRQIAPAAKELFLYLALPNSGKTWFLCQLGKQALLDKRKVLHISLEMSEAKTMERYMMILFSITKRKLEHLPEIKKFVRDSYGSLESVEVLPLDKHRPSFKDDDIKKQLSEKIEKYGPRLSNLLIKQFPTNQLNIKQLGAYLDGLERHYNWIPDLILVDYADLMEMKGPVREATGQIYKELRGLAVERNVAVATASQSNRAGMSAKLLTMENLAEDFSKAGICDNIITYNQTPEEKLLNLARIHTAKVRGEASGETFLISQAYWMGQYCLDDVEMRINPSLYWNEVKSLTEDWDEDEDD